MSSANHADKLFSEMGENDCHSPRSIRVLILDEHVNVPQHHRAIERLIFIAFAASVVFYDFLIP
jgi:hypothetical protein